MHSVSVCLCQSESMCAHTFYMWLHCFDFLLFPDLRTKTASSSSWGWGGSATSILTQNTC